MDDFKPELTKALLDWVNKNDIPRRINSWGQLEDGQVLWQILKDLDPQYFKGPLPENDNRRTSENWIPRWQNLKYIERAVSTYIAEECGQLPALTKRMVPGLKNGAPSDPSMLTAKVKPDAYQLKLHAIAAAKVISQLTMAVLLAGLYSPKSNQRMIQIMEQLGQQAGEAIASAIQGMQALDERMAELGVDQAMTPEPHAAAYATPPRAQSVERDATNELEQEAQLFEITRERNQLKAQCAKVTDELQQTRNKISSLEEELIEARLHLDNPRDTTAASDDYEELRAETSRDRQLIAELETDLQNAKDQVASQERQLQRLKADDATKQDLRDELQVTKADRDELAQKAKANENLKKKIESMSQQLRNLETLRQDLQSAREEITRLEQYEERCPALEKANKEATQTIVQCETSIFEEKGKRTRVEHENQLLTKQLEQMKDVYEVARREYDDRLREMESSHRGTGEQSLEDELAQDESTILEEPNGAKITTDGQITSETITLQQKVDVLSARLKSMENEYLTQLQENLGLKSDMTVSNDEESQRPFLEQNQKLQATETELQEAQRKLREKELENAELRNDINKAPNGTSEEQQVHPLQKENERLLAAYQKLQRHNQGLELSLDEKTSLLRTALLDHDNLPGGLKEARKAELLREIKGKIRAVMEANPEEQPKVLDAAAGEITDRVQGMHEALDMAKKDLQSQESLSTSLRSQLEKLKTEAKEQASEELLQDVQNLRRENKLMTTAWYDITSRLQSNTVVLQRSGAPKSWLGRQREVVGGGRGVT